MSSLVNKQASERGTILFVTETEGEKDTLAKSVFVALGGKFPFEDTYMRSVTLHLPEGVRGASLRSLCFVSNEQLAYSLSYLDNKSHIYFTGSIPRPGGGSIKMSSNCIYEGIRYKDMYAKACQHLVKLGLLKEEKV